MQFIDYVRQKIFRRPGEFINVVSGLPRSGTSLMQGMLQAGGIEPLTDGIRTADDNNPKGYFEYERVKALRQGDAEWLSQAQGKSIKIISWLLEYIPSSYQYRVLFMQRNMDEILKSQVKMLADRGEPADKVSDEELAKIYQGHLDQVKTWLGKQRHIKVVYVDYNQLMADPMPSLNQVNSLFDNRLQVEAMLKVIDVNLYRQRKP